MNCIEKNFQKVQTIFIINNYSYICIYIHKEGKKTYSVFSFAGAGVDSGLEIFG